MIFLYLKERFFIGDIKLIDKNLVLRKISELEERTKELEEFKDISVELYSKDWKIQRIIERTLHIAIEICIDLANHIISEEGFRTPTSYSDVFRVLYENNVISSELCETMEKMSKFRNILVHNYAKIDPQLIVRILKENLRDFRSYINEILNWLS